MARAIFFLCGTALRDDVMNDDYFQSNGSSYSGRIVSFFSLFPFLFFFKVSWVPLAVEHAHCENRFQLVNIAASRRRPAVAAKRIRIIGYKTRTITCESARKKNLVPRAEDREGMKRMVQQKKNLGWENWSLCGWLAVVEQQRHEKADNQVA